MAEADVGTVFCCCRTTRLPHETPKQTHANNSSRPLSVADSETGAVRDPASLSCFVSYHLALSSATNSTGIVCTVDTFRLAARSALAAFFRPPFSKSSCHAESILLAEAVRVSSSARAATPSQRFATAGKCRLMIFFVDTISPRRRCWSLLYVVHTTQWQAFRLMKSYTLLPTLLCSYSVLPASSGESRKAIKSLQFRCLSSPASPSSTRPPSLTIDLLCESPLESG